MTSAIHYKVKSAGVGGAAGGGGGGGGWQSIHFDGVYLPCHELKKRIIYNEGWCRSEHDANFDLQVSNSSSGEGEWGRAGAQRERGEEEERRAPVDVGSVFYALDCH